jgi:hypothetical protein
MANSGEINTRIIMFVLFFIWMLIFPVSTISIKALTPAESVLVYNYVRLEPTCKDSELLLFAKNDANKKQKIDNIVYQDWFCVPDRQTVEKACSYTVLDNYEPKENSPEYTAKNTLVISFLAPSSDKYSFGNKNYLVFGGENKYYSCVAPGFSQDNEPILNDGSYKRDFDIFSEENYNKYTALVKNKFADIRCQDYKLLIYSENQFEEDDQTSFAKLECKTLPEIEKECTLSQTIDNKKTESPLYFVPSNFEVSNPTKQIKPNFYSGKEIRDYFECADEKIVTQTQTEKEVVKVAETSEKNESNILFFGILALSGLLNIVLAIYIIKQL